MENLFLNSNDIEKMEKRFRTNFFNSVWGFKAANLVGTINKHNQSNLATISSAFHLGANPALVGIVIRPDSVDRHTFENILETNQFTLNNILKSFYKNAHQTSARYPREVSEFNATRLTQEFTTTIVAPYVKQSSIKIGLSLQEVLPVKSNGCTILVGKVEEVVVVKNAILNDGFVDLEKAGSITISGLDSYHETTKIARLSYAKPDKPVEEIGYGK
ncbi:MAG: flavin reductase [Bacteroidota bacterium]